MTTYPGINKTDLINLVIRPALDAIQCEDASKRQAAVQLLLGTAAQESQCGRYLKQSGSGPAMGIFQMEPVTHDSLWANFIAYRPLLASKVQALRIPSMSNIEQLAINLRYAAAMCRIKYFDSPAALPVEGDFAGMGRFYKSVYNSAQGAGTAQQFEMGLRALLA